MKRKKKPGKNRQKLRFRVEHFKLDFDKRREQVIQNFPVSVKTLADVRRLLRVSYLQQAIDDAKNQTETQIINGKRAMVLPIPLIQKEPLLDNFLSLISDYTVTFQTMIGNVGHFDPVPFEEFKKYRYLSSMFDTFSGMITDEIVFGDQTELMILDIALARKVINASNSTTLVAEDLCHLPFDRTYIEFSEPVDICTIEDTTLKARGVGFYNGKQNGTYVVSWNLVNFPGAIDGNTAGYVIDYLTNVHGFQRLILDSTCYETGFGKSIRTSFVIKDGQVIPDYNKPREDLIKRIIQISRNIWDFITCRNIDYELKKRGGTHYQKPQHNQGARSTKIREYKVLRVNKTIKNTEKSKHAVPRMQGYSERIPGTFHKWVYCRDCNRVHRHDLIGTPCRRCQKQVGPLSNLVIKKWWHDSYTIGTGPLKQVVREVEE